MPDRTAQKKKKKLMLPRVTWAAVRPLSIRGKEQPESFSSPQTDTATGLRLRLGSEAPHSVCNWPETAVR